MELLHTFETSISHDELHLWCDKNIEGSKKEIITSLLWETNTGELTFNLTMLERIFEYKSTILSKDLYTLLSFLDLSHYNKWLIYLIWEYEHWKKWLWAKAREEFEKEENTMLKEKWVEILEFYSKITQKLLWKIELNAIFRPSVTKESIEWLQHLQHTNQEKIINPLIQKSHFNDCYNSIYWRINYAIYSINRESPDIAKKTIVSLPEKIQNICLKDNKVQDLLYKKYEEVAQYVA